MGNPPLAVAPGQLKSSCNYGYEFFYVTLCIHRDMHQKFAPMLGLLHPNCYLGGGGGTCQGRSQGVDICLQTIFATFRIFIIIARIGTDNILGLF